MTTHVHAPRRSPAVVESPLDLGAAADDLLAQARTQRAGRAGRTLTPGAGAPLKQSLLALVGGQRLQDHRAPGPTTLLSLRGTAVLRWDSEAVTLSEGVWVSCPTQTHALEAVSDAVLLITVAGAPEHND